MVAEPMCRVGGLVVAEPMCRLVKSDFRSHSGSHQSTAWIQNPSWSRSTEEPGGWLVGGG